MTSTLSFDLFQGQIELIFIYLLSISQYDKQKHNKQFSVEKL